MADGCERCPRFTGDLTVDGVVQHNPAWSVVSSLAPLWYPSSEIEASNVVMPTQQATAPVPSVLTEIVLPVRILLCGEWSPTGDPYPDPAEGLMLNLIALAQYWGPTAAPLVDMGARPITVAAPGGVTLEGYGQTSRPKHGDLLSGVSAGVPGAVMRLTATLTVMDGQLWEV